MGLPPKPKFEKESHHVVPALWQRRFAAMGDPGPYYLNILKDQCLKARGPGEKMAEPYVNIVFDEFYRPCDGLEDRLSKIETKVVCGLDKLIMTGVMDDSVRVDIAMLLALQACRYPEKYSNLLDLGKYLAIALQNYQDLPNVAVLNMKLQETGMLPGASLSETEFRRLQGITGGELANEVGGILKLHGYEAHFNPIIVIDAVQQVADHLLGLHWKLLHASVPAFILSDRPVPSQIGYGFSVGLSASYGLVLTMPEAPVTDGEILRQSAMQSEIDAVNSEVRGRAREWICGPGSWVHKL